MLQQKKILCYAYVSKDSEVIASQRQVGIFHFSEKLKSQLSDG